MADDEKECRRMSQENAEKLLKIARDKFPDIAAKIAAQIKQQCPDWIEEQ